MTDTNTPDDRLPDSLIEELARRDQAPRMITSRADRNVAAATRAHFGTTRTRRPQHVGAWLAAAACAVFAVGLTTNLLTGRDGAPVYRDIDGSGQIDIADVLALAREGAPQAQIDAFAFHVVALNQDEQR